jgi:hypothetical protein
LRCARGHRRWSYDPTTMTAPRASCDFADVVVDLGLMNFGTRPCFH